MEPEVHSQNGVVIPNPPSHVDGLTGDPRPKVIGMSSWELPNEGVNHYVPYPTLHAQPAHSTSMASLHSAGGAAHYPPMQPIPPGLPPPMVGMWAPHLHNHRRTASGGSLGVTNTSPLHSRQPSDMTTDGRRYPEYSYYYPYQYQYIPQYMYMHGSPVGHRRVATMDPELEAYHDRQGSGNSTQAPRRPLTADLLEREGPRGVSPMYPHYAYYHHYPQESDMSHMTSASEQPIIYPFPRREPLKMLRGYPSAGRILNDAGGDTNEGKESMEHFLDSQLEQQRNERVIDVIQTGSNDFRSDASEVSSTAGKPDSSVDLGKSVNSIESEVL